MEQRLHIPPWSKRKRVITTIIATCFILIVSLCIGYGVYIAGVNSGKIAKPFSKETILESLLTDAAFNQAVKKSVKQRFCENTKIGFSLNYQSPLRPVHLEGEQACMEFATTHPTGETTKITVEKQHASKENLATNITKQFRFVQSDSITASSLEASRISGVKGDIPTTVFLLKESPETTWIITYAPTSAIIDGKVLSLVESFRLF